MELQQLPAYQLGARAAGFLEAARLCIDHGQRPSVLFAPILHLAAHGIEVYLKAELVHGGSKLDNVRKDFGHDIFLLWQHPESRRVRAVVEREAHLAWERTRSSCFYEDSFNEDPVELLREYIEILGKLHGKESDFALRYIAPPGTEGPRPQLLIDSFAGATDDLLKRIASECS